MYLKIGYHAVVHCDTAQIVNVQTLYYYATLKQYRYVQSCTGVLYCIYTDTEQTCIAQALSCYFLQYIYKHNSIMYCTNAV
jgi:hypothetical protein